MSKRINQKNFFLLFIISALTTWSSTKPMISSSDPCERPSTGKKITDLPQDCLNEIFQLANLASLTMLPFVCKQFKQAVRDFTNPHFIQIDCINKKISELPGHFFSIKTLILKNIDFKQIKMTWPNNLQTLFIQSCENCDSIPTLKSETLHTLQVNICHNFDGKFLEGLTNLRKLGVFMCFEFDKTLDTIEQLKKNGCEVDIY